MKTLLYAVTTMSFLIVGQFSPAMAVDPKASDGNSPAGRSLASQTTVRTASASSPVTRQTRSGSTSLYELDPEMQRLYDEIMQWAGAPRSETR
jgi:hypothetical protein